MFNSLLGSRKDGQPSETTPLLEALARYRSRNDEHSGSEAEDYVAAQYHGGEDDEDEDEDDGNNQRDGPLLPVFSAEFLGTYLPFPHTCCSPPCLHGTNHPQTVSPSTTRPMPSASSSSNNARPPSPGTSCDPRRSRSFWSSPSSSASSPTTFRVAPYTVCWPTACSSAGRARCTREMWASTTRGPSSASCWQCAC